MHNNWFTGPGSCHGDSGGPLFTKTIYQGKIRPVLLGVASKGQSSIGNCGGIDNPTHYVRIQKLHWWIKRYIQGSDKLCYVNSKGKRKRVRNIGFIALPP